MLRTGWFSSVYVKSVDTHRLKALLGARDQLVKLKRSLGNQVRGLLRPFGIKLPSRAGGKRFDEAAYLAARNDPILHAAIRALLESLASIEGQQARLDDEFDELAKRNEIAWRLMSVPGVGRITALAYMAAIENVERFRRTRDIGAYLGLTERRYQSAETNVGMGISTQGDDGAALAILLERRFVASQGRRKLQQFLAALMNQQGGAGLSPRVVVLVADARAQWAELETDCGLRR